MAKGKPYPKEFKDEAVRLSVTSGKTIAQVAKDLGVNEHTLQVWRRDAISERRMPVPDHETDQQKIRRLEKELKLITEERDIIKKAIAYFTQPPKK
jgi:transposase